MFLSSIHTPALSSANYSRERELDFDSIRENRFHDLTNDEELARIEDERLKYEAKKIVKQNKKFDQVIASIKVQLGKSIPALNLI